MIFFSHNSIYFLKLSQYSVLIDNFFSFFQEKMSVHHKKITHSDSKAKNRPHFREAGMFNYFVLPLISSTC